MKFSTIPVVLVTAISFPAESVMAGFSYFQDCHLLSTTDKCCDGDRACEQSSFNGGDAIVGLGACNGNVACTNAGEMNGFANIANYACVGDEVCGAIGGMDGYCDVGSYSCSNHQYVCSGVGSTNGRVTIGTSSCTANSACTYAGSSGNLAIGDNSCTGPNSCQWAAAYSPTQNQHERPNNIIGSNSCTAPYACTDAGRNGGDILIGEYSCTDFNSCMAAASQGFNHPKIRIGSHSCTAPEACLGTASRGGDLIIRDYSCTASESCAGLSMISIGSNSCTCERCCKCLQDGDVIPADSCHNLGECCNQDNTRNADYIAILQATNNGGAGGDPHFHTWTKEHYEYHGQCDLLMVKDTNFADGLGLDIHIRTKIVRYWSYIKTVAIKIGNDILEIEGSAEADDNTPHYWINFEYQGELDSVGGFPVIQKLPSAFKRQYIIDLSPKYPKQSIVVQLYKEFVRVKFTGTEEAFGNTVGLLGDYKTGMTFARDGATVIHDFTELGDEWQVLPSDGKLFRQAATPQFPELCIKPENSRGERKRRLAESSITIKQAEAACATLKDALWSKDCVYDILATQDLGMVGAF